MIPDWEVVTGLPDANGDYTAGTPGVDAIVSVTNTAYGPTLISFPTTGSLTAKMRSKLLGLPANSTALATAVTPGPVRYDVVFNGVVNDVQYVRLDWFNAAQTYLESTVIQNANPSAAGYAYYRGTINPPQAVGVPAYVRIVAGRHEPATNNGFVGLLHASIMAAHRAFHAYANAVTAIAAGSVWTKILFEVERYDYGPGFATSAWNPTSGQTNAQTEKMVMHFDASVEADRPTAGKRFVIALFKNGTLWQRGISIYGTSGEDVVNLSVSADMEVLASDTVDVRVWSNDTVARNALATDPDQTWFTGHEISP